jgi:hypothetical protein
MHGSMSASAYHGGQRSDRQVCRGLKNGQRSHAKKFISCALTPQSQSRRRQRCPRRRPGPRGRPARG